MKQPRDVVVAGVDGCPAGWFVVARFASGLEPPGTSVRGDGALFFEGATSWLCAWRRSFAEVVNLVGGEAVIGVDIPIGLLDHAGRGGRRCDREARVLLGPGRTSSVFSAPSRDALDSPTHREANARSKAGSVESIGLSIQTFNIMSKVREVDDVLRQGGATQERVHEVHPELAFWEMGGRGTLPPGKKTVAGRQERQRLVEATGWFSGLDLGRTLARFPRALVGRDDILDAAAACWSAGRLARDEARRVPERPPVDRHGLRMEICW